MACFLVFGWLSEGVSFVVFLFLVVVLFLVLLWKLGLRVLREKRALRARLRVASAPTPSARFARNTQRPGFRNKIGTNETPPNVMLTCVIC